MSRQRLCECGCGQPAPIATQTRSHVPIRQGEAYRFIRGHNMRLREHSPRRVGWPSDVKARILALSWLDGRGCWQWRGAINTNGYAAIGWRDNGRTPVFQAHRVAYEAWRGPIPAGLHAHHICFSPTCVNPYHVEPMRQRDHNVLHAELRGERWVG